MPVLIASVIVFFEFQNLETIYGKVNLIKIADDINLTILELRRYEKNILFFEEEQNLRIFYENLELLKSKVYRMKNEIISELSKVNYKHLEENIRLYEETAGALILNIKKEHQLIEDIRPLGRDIEKMATNKEMALELRRQEKNFIIYKESNAVGKLHNIAKGLVNAQLTLSFPVTFYINTFDSLVKAESLKQDLIKNIRHYGREIEQTTSNLSKKKREDIDKIISKARKSFIVSFTFLIVVAMILMWPAVSHVVNTIKVMEKSFNKLADGDFTQTINVSTPYEIGSFANAYNRTIKKLGESKAELDHTLQKLEETNRELLLRQDELVEMRKVTAMRLLSSEIAHEISNPLSSLTIFLGMFYEDISEADPRREDIALMLKEVNRCQLVLRELVDFARKEPLQLKEINPQKLINEAIEIVYRQNSEKAIQLSSYLGGLPGKVILDPILIHQALVNILTNAYQFSSAGGNISIDGYTHDNSMIIAIKDTGIGIAEEDLPHIFEPFFSTRKDLGGSGLGLALTKKIIERHNGNIHVESKLGIETVFEIRLPVNQELQ